MRKETILFLRCAAGCIPFHEKQGYYDHCDEREINRHNNREDMKRDFQTFLMDMADRMEEQDA